MFPFPVCDDTCREVVMDPTNELLVCTISGHCFDRLISTAEMEQDAVCLNFFYLLCFVFVISHETFSHKVSTLCLSEFSDNIRTDYDSPCVTEPGFCI